MVMDIKTSFTQAHLENELWANELRFYHQEINIFSEHLEKRIDNNTSLQESEKAELMLNQLARFREMVNNLQHELVSAETKMAMYAKSHVSMDLDAVNVADHYQFRQAVELFKSNYLTFKKEYKAFELV
jgi:hypothetical protein